MIHKFSLRGYNIVIDVNSGSVHIVDDLVYKLLDVVTAENLEGNFEISGYSNQEIKTAVSEIANLYKNGELFSTDDLSNYADKEILSPIKALCLHVAHDCNLRCKYCFAATGDFGEGRKLMPFEVAKKSIDFLIENSGSRVNLELDFFGGEPLMNFDVVKETVKYARGLEKKHNKNFRFTITTNGVLLDDDKIDFINKEMSNVVLSIDGRKCVNDAMRKTISGDGSYDVIIPKLLKLCEKRGFKNYFARGTFTKENLDFSEDVYHLNEIGFNEISVEPAVSDSKYSYALTKEDLPTIFAEYERLADRMLVSIDNDNGFNFFHFNIDLSGGPCAIKRLRGCGSGNEYVAITPEGDIYPCHQFVGIPEYLIGSIYTGEFNQEIKAKFSTANIYNKEDCKDCWAKFYCSGGCNANNYIYMGDILKSESLSCEMEKKRLECAIMMQAAQLEG